MSCWRYLENRTSESEILLRGELIELRAYTRDGYGVFAEIKTRIFPSRLGFQHAIARFRCAAGFGNDQHESLAETG